MEIIYTSISYSKNGEHPTINFFFPKKLKLKLSLIYLKKIANKTFNNFITVH